MKNKIAILIIDPQNDFCHPEGSLFVKGSIEDNERLSNWIIKNKTSIDYVGVTIDLHQLIDIAHPGYWVDSDGNNPNPFTVISVEDVKNGVWTPINNLVGQSINYLQALEDGGEYAHVVWPEHCVSGTWGNLIESRVNDAILSWARLGNYVNYIYKGSNPDTEHFGALEAQVSFDNSNNTKYNKKLESYLNENDVIYLAGQAKSHCVAYTLKQIIENAPEMAKKIIVLEDTMSPVGGGPSGPDTTPTFDELSQPIFDEARELGVRFSTTEEEID